MTVTTDMTVTTEQQCNFLSHHAHVMLVLARDPESRVRDIAAAVGITERAVQRILYDLAQAGALARERVGRRNRYQLNWDLPLPHPLEREHTIGELLDLLADLSTRTTPRTRRPSPHRGVPVADGSS